MATMFNGALRPDCMLAQNVQAWASWIESVLTTIGGWTVTSDTGQTPPASLPVGTASNQKLGYRIYQMNDAFTAVNPIYMRIDYGTGNDGSPYKPGMWFSIGMGTNGAGSLTSVLWNGVNNYNRTDLSTITTNTQAVSGNFVTNSYASADNSRFVFGIFVEPLGQSTMCFSLERTRDANGNYTGDGLMICFTDLANAGGGGTTQTLSTSLYLACAGGWQPPLEKSISWIYPTSPPSQHGGGVPVGMISHFRAFAQQPGYNIVLVDRTAMSSEGQLLVNMYGVNRIYQNLGAIWAGKPTAGPIGSVGTINDAGIAVCILWE